MEIATDAEMALKLSNSPFRGALDELFGQPVWILPLKELKRIKKAAKTDQKIAKILDENHITTKKFEKADRLLIARLRKREGKASNAEIESIAIAKNRNLLFITGDLIARELCSRLGVRYMTLPMLLKAFWAKNILTKKEVWRIIDGMEQTELIRIQKKEMIFGED